MQTVYKEYFIGQTQKPKFALIWGIFFFQMLVERFLRKFSVVRSLTRIKNSGKQQQIFKFGTYYIGANVQRTLFWKFGNGRILKGFYWALNAIKLKIAFLSSVGRRTISNRPTIWRKDDFQKRKAKNELKTVDFQCIW